MLTKCRSHDHHTKHLSASELNRINKPLHGTSTETGRSNTRVQHPANQDIRPSLKDDCQRAAVGFNLNQHNERMGLLAEESYTKRRKGPSKSRHCLPAQQRVSRAVLVRKGTLIPVKYKASINRRTYHRQQKTGSPHKICFTNRRVPLTSCPDSEHLKARQTCHRHQKSG
jgi:hypothetical protein